MFFNGERSSPDHLLPDTFQKESEPLPSWHSRNAKQTSRLRHRRVRILAAAIVASCALTGLLTWATTSICPAPRVAITLASTDYRDHLNLPINGFGDQAIGRLASLTEMVANGGISHFRLTCDPTELAHKNSFTNFAFDRDASVSLFFVSAHGINTAGGAALLPGDAVVFTDAVPVGEIIRQMAELPSAQHKVLLIDAVHFQSLPSFGIIHNDFARQMRELEGLIESIPNLVVIVSADNDQLSWNNPDRGTSAWAAAMIDALCGKADDLQNDGWIDLYDIHHYVTNTTQAYAGKYVGEPQNALLLPGGSVGETRSRRITFFAAGQPLADFRVIAHSPRNEILGKWTQCHRDFTQREIHPCIVAPVQWQHFEATLQRLEEFELAGCRDAADACVQRLSELADELSLPTLIDSVACRAGVLNPELVGFDPDQELMLLAKQLETSLLAISGDDAKRTWLSVVANQRHAESVAYLRHTLMLSYARQTSRSIRESKKIDRQLLNKVAELIDCIRDPVQPPAQIGLILQFLARDLPSDSFVGDDALRIARWIDLCLKVETISENHDWWTPAVVQWTKDGIASADQSRRLAGDLLFGDAAARARADQYLLSAEEEYSAVMFVADVVSKSESVTSEGRYQLRRLHKLCDAALNSVVAEEMFNHASRIVSLYALIDEIGAVLDSDDTRSAQQCATEIARLQELSSRFELQIHELIEQFDRWQIDALDNENPDQKSLRAALSSHGGDAERRVSAWLRLCRSISSEADNNPRDISPDEQLTRIWKVAAARGSLALGAWPSNTFDSVIAEPRETKLQVQHRLLTFEADPKWWVALHKAGQEIGRRECWSPFLADGTGVPRIVSEHPDLLGCSVVPMDFAFSLQREREKSVGKFLLFQAGRVYRDGFWSLHQLEPPYYLHVSNLLTSDSISMLQGTAPAQSGVSQQDLNDDRDPVGFETDVPKQVIWTTQQHESFPVSFRSRSECAAGFVAVWSQPHDGIELLQPTAGERNCRAFGDIDLPKTIVSNSTISPLSVSFKRIIDGDAQTGQINIFTYFRGRLECHQVAMQYVDRADVEISNPPRSKGGHIAVRSDQKMASANGSAVTLVLDCSGSMGAKSGEPFGTEAKYFHSVAAVKNLLELLPTGTELSIWAFGQATGPAKTVQQAEQSIRQIQSAIVWDANDLELRQQIVDSISYPALDPWNESPLLATMLAAKNDLKGFDGTRSLVVITDGFDNRIEFDPVANPLSLAPREWLLKNFNGTGITVNVVAFRVDDNEKDQTRKQLAVVEELLPSGQFIEIDQAQELAKTLGQLLCVSPVLELQRVDATKNPAELKSLALTRGSDNALTWTDRLEPGLYKIGDKGGRKSTLVQLNDGEYLMLHDLQSLQPGGDSVSRNRFELWPVLIHEFRWCRQKQVGRWQVGLQPLVSADSRSVQRRLLFSTPSSTDVIALEAPRGLWVEASQQGQPLKVQWRAINDQACASVDVSVEYSGSTEPDLSVWVSDQAALPVASLRKGYEFLQSSDLESTRIQVSGGAVRIISAGVETHQVVDGDGTTKALPCFVLRAEVPAGLSHFFRTEGLAFEGFDEQHFVEHGHYTLRQWPVSNEQVVQSLRAIHVISIDQFKESVELHGGCLTFEGMAEANSRVPDRMTSVIQSRSEP